VAKPKKAISIINKEIPKKISHCDIGKFKRVWSNLFAPWNFWQANFI
jgi:hypothetical protein